MVRTRTARPARARRSRLLVALLGTLALIVPVTLVATSGSAVAAGPGTNYAVDDPFTSARTYWWRSSRYGMFIHFGDYSYWEGEYTRPDGSVCQNAEWILNRCNIPMSEYEAAEYKRPGSRGVQREPGRRGGRSDVGCGEPVVRRRQAVPVGVLLAGCGQPAAPDGARPVPDHRRAGTGQQPDGDLEGGRGRV